MNGTRQFTLGRSMQLAGLLFLSSNLLLSQAASQMAREERRTDTQRKIKTLSGRFAEILAPTDRERQLQADCHLNCAAVADTATGKTVAQELDEIANAHNTALDRVIAEVETSLDDYIVKTVRITDPNLASASAADDLGLILQDEAVQPPAAFILRSPKGNSLLVFYGLNRGMSLTSTSVLRVYAAGANGLRLSDSTSADMDDYGNLEVRELHSPKTGEIWLLVSGQMMGANGPNIRMRVVACDGKKFRNIWMPANQWGWFTNRVTQDGFTVDGDYYRSNRHRHEAYFLAPDGLYLKRPGQ
jgi:hypothetical protein